MAHMREVGKVEALYIAPIAKGPIQQRTEVMALAGRGIEDDCYSRGEGSFSEGEIGNRQVSLVSSLFFPSSGFGYEGSRRNIVTANIELMALIGKEFQIGAAVMRGVEYC